MQSETIVYLVSSDTALAKALKALLGVYDIQVQSHHDTESFVAALDKSLGGHCCLLLELASAEAPGLSLLSDLNERGFHCPVIVLADDIDEQLRTRVIENGATDIIDKPLVATYLFSRLADLVPGGAKLPETAVSRMEMADGTEITFRIMHPEDADIEQAFVKKLSDQSRYLRFFSGIKELPTYMLQELTNPNFPISYALIATVPDGDGELEIGVARYAPTETTGVAEFAVTVADDWQGKGIASQLMRGVMAAAAVGGIERLEGIVLKENVAMLGLAKSLGFHKTADSGAGPSVVRVARDLQLGK